MSFTRTSVRVATGVFSLAVSSCAGESAEGKGSDSAGDSAGLVGNPAPDFHVQPFSGSEGATSLKKMRGKVVLVDFWGTFCEPCKKSFPKLAELSSKYSDRGFEVIGVSEDDADDKSKIPVFAKSYGATFTVMWDEDKSIARAYKPETMPSSFLIDKRGVVRYAHGGYHDGEEAEVEKEIKDLLAQ